MKKRIISFILTICILSGCIVVPASADEEYPVKNYYNIQLKHVSYDGYTDFISADFMIRQNKKDGAEQVYIKAEDFADVTGLSGYSYEYNQCYTECAYVSNHSGHVVRFMLNSSNASVLYVGQPVLYNAPYQILYEDGVTWIPFEFAIKLFHMQAVPQGKTIVINSVEYNPISAANVAHSQVRNLGFDWMGEVGESAFSNFIGKNSAGLATCCNRLLSFELGEWGAVLLSLGGSTYAYNSEFAEKISKTFISPSQQEIKQTESTFLEIVADSPDAYDSIMTAEMKSGDVSQFVNFMLEKFPKLGKNKAVDKLKDVLGEKDMKKFANDVFAKMGKAYDDYGEKSAGYIDKFLKFVQVMEYYMIFMNKSERAVSALEQYAKNSDYDESQVFKEYASSTGVDLLDAVGRVLLDEVDNGLDGATKWFGVIGLEMEALGFVWDLISGVGPLKTGISATENRTISEYAVKYQDECLGLYYDKRNACTANGGADEKKLDEMINSLYAYLKFSYIARNAAAGSFEDTADMLFGNENMKNNAKILNEKNEKVAKFLTLMEQDIFTPTKAGKYKWDDTAYVQTLRENGTPIECPTQDTVPVFELPEFPGVEGIDYITEEEAKEIAAKVTDRFTGGLLNGFLGEIMTEAMGVDELYTYEVIGHYMGEDESAYVVAMMVNGRADALYFVSIIGNEVWFGSPAPSEPSGYYVYTDLDLLHAGIDDLVGAIGGLTGELMGELMKES